MNLKKQTFQLLKNFHLHPQKKLGQNFLINENLCEKISHFLEINKHDLIFEIGTGIGNLTKYLAEKAGFVISCEIDKNLLKIAQEQLSNFSNLKLIQENFLDLDLKKIIEDQIKIYPELKEIKICGNLPYYITTPILEKIIENRFLLSKAILTVQKEVAQRITAPSGSRIYGSLSIFVQFFMETEILLKINPEAFYPSPKVSSSVISLLPRKKKFNVDNEEFFFKIVRTAFSQRRKTLVNALQKLTDRELSKEVLKKIISKLVLSPQVRAEELTIEDFVRLSNVLLALSG